MDPFNQKPERRRRRGEDVEGAPAPSSTFLGTLRSELDVEGVLPAQFVALYATFESALGAYQRNELTKIALAEHLRALRCRDSSGVEWTLGASSLQWYRRGESGAWQPATPPSVGVGELDGEWEGAPGAAPAFVAPELPPLAGLGGLSRDVLAAGPSDPGAVGGWPSELQPPALADALAAPPGASNEPWTPPRRADAGEAPPEDWQPAPRVGSAEASADLDAFLSGLALDDGPPSATSATSELPAAGAHRPIRPPDSAADPPPPSPGPAPSKSTDVDTLGNGPIDPFDIGDGFSTGGPGEEGYGDL